MNGAIETGMRAAAEVESRQPVVKVRPGDVSALLTWPFKIRTIAIIVFQFRVVAGTP